jgi:hypothetical protein
MKLHGTLAPAASGDCRPSARPRSLRPQAHHRVVRSLALAVRGACEPFAQQQVVIPHSSMQAIGSWDTVTNLMAARRVVDPWPLAPALPAAGWSTTPTDLFVWVAPLSERRGRPRA